MPLQMPQNNKLEGYGEQGHDLICHLGYIFFSIVATSIRNSIYRPRTIPSFHTTKDANAIKQRIYGVDAIRIDGSTAGRLAKILKKSAILTLVAVHPETKAHTWNSL